MPTSHPLPQVELFSAAGDSPPSGDVLVLGVDASLRLQSVASDFDSRAGGALSALMDAGEITGKRGEIVMLTSPDVRQHRLVMVIGLGDSPGRREAFELASTVVRQFTDRQRETLVIAIAEGFDEEHHDALVAGALFGCESQAIYRHTSPSFFAPTSIHFVGVSAKQLDRGRAIGQSINFTRRLVNEPAGVIYPESFVERVATHLEGSSLKFESWDEHRLESEGCRAILAVGQGSVRPPRLLMIRHRGGPDDQPPLVLVGKGVTFDSGGLSIKPSDGMVDMKCDMAGAATVVGVMKAIAELAVPTNVIGFCGLAENMVSGTSYKLGDVIETRSGKTIEILNTDAEGRVVLADTLDVAIQHQPEAMVDLATLTGACMVALGTDVTGLMANDAGVCQRIEEAAEGEGEPVWELPMFSLYDEKIKSKVADIKNVGEGRWGGAITAAKFLENFVGDTPWVHIDIAGPAFADSSLPHRDAGATGVMVRTLIRWIENR